jgi:hypothetical protein
MPKRKMALTYRLRYDEHDLSRYIDLPCSAGKTTIQISRQDKDVLTARAGTTIACMNANCAKRSSDKFPHPVYLAVFTNTSAYIVDKLTAGGQPKHCVWYRHNDREAISIHDKLGPKAIIDKGLSQRVVTLRPPKVRLGQSGTEAGRAPRESNPSVPGPNKTVLTTGARKRAQAAGILVIP